ncbi:acetate CoA/acetoacetate CoA-transferase alpha subunit [Acetoanaerobium pronyense]|uniref:Acetate CoA/acetoacetate CoA-transferase alpha subunit n=1 Tax=Acetoanaerobium pronyense TaxID=1482736 RepID=A0ABS4KGX6_9FIRM|nr:acetate CoA-transferase subunit alpha [Acetoanaerobium pronyense]MBP2027007.1 acetate CoA/acetoacetate CoA-transferase alpha subunit [Acetoanaerobium pronyense]
MKKVVSLDTAMDKIQDGMVLMIGGFLGCGTPEIFIDELVKRNVQNLTIIANDTSFIDKGLGKLIANKQVKKVVTSHIGTNQETGKQMLAEELEVDLVPQGTLIERIRCAGTGLGGVLTPTGIGTLVEEGKEKIIVDGNTFLLEKPLKADVALILGNKVDSKGNIVYSKSARNFNPLMAMAADTVIAYAENLVEVGDIDPDSVVTPSILVDYIVKEK